ncbi:MAG TPA: baseplate J/gp47 family protein, partial [Casimicrobiaceae bacterium]|nr:baseplate J/gp47 family protein [Casimicrobiaceae bacterium]
MAISVDDYPTTQSQIVSFFRNRLPGKDDHSESWIGKLARCVAMAIWGFKQAAIAIDNDAVPSNKTSDAGMAVWANAVGVPNGQGGYGPLTAQPASGGAGNCTGTNGTVYPAGALLYAPDGVTLIQLVNSVSIPGSPPGTGSVLGTFAAVTPGTVGNIAAGSVLTWASAPSGSDPTVTLSTGLTNGIDVETTPQLYGRVAARMQKPPKGGAEVDYASWAIAAPQAQGSSVNRGYPYPGRGGLGTVHLLITQQGSGAGRVPSTAMQTAVTNYIV